MAQEELKLRLTELLEDIFQFDFSKDLDFGIYKIMNYKKKEIKEFIDKELIEAIKKQLKLISDEEKKRKQEKINDIKQKITKTFGENAFKNGGLKDQFKDTPLGKKYTEALNELEKIKISSELEADVYNHIINFFSRYYDKGDFISKRRFGRNERYVIPYNGEEVLLHWANSDQYYVKTAEWFKKYTFRHKGLEVNFRITKVEEEKNNVKSKNSKYFILSKKSYELKGNEFNIFLEFKKLSKEEKKKFGERAKQDDINKQIFQDLKNKFEKEKKAKVLFDKENDKTILEKHLYRYTRRNTMDYFIHTNLKGFLERELDFYIKNEILNLENIDNVDKEKMDIYLLESKVVKHISNKIIDFISQIENFQKKLWEKKKFVIDSNYVITIDKLYHYLDEKVANEIADEALKNKDQLEEWKDFFGIDVKNRNGIIQKPEKIDGKAYKKLSIDTKYFNEEFKWKLIISLTENNNLDEILDGLLVKSENWQALNLLNKKYSEKIKCTYLDPPFNSKSTEIIYKNTYKHSSWITLMENRLTSTKDLLSKDGSVIVAIDENEQERLGLLLDLLFPEYDKTCVTVIHNPGGIQGENFSYCHEYAYFIYPTGGKVIGLQDREENADIRPLRDVSKGDHLRESAANCFYPILVKDKKIIGFDDVCDDSFHPDSANIPRENGVIEVYPIDAQGNERKWVFARNSVESIKDQLNVEYNKKRKIWDIIRTKTRFNYKTVWTDKKYNSNTYGSKLLNNIMGRESFSFPKSVYNVLDCINTTTQNSKNSIILDFFAGSGTTGHSVMLLNAEDEGNRKFILVEMAEYFDDVIIPRIKKVAYSFNWQKGKPQGMDGIGIFFKYQSLEQYEDALENIEFEQKTVPEFKDYFVKYMLEFETKKSKTFLNIDELQDPFNYKIWIMENYQRKNVTVDLVETFNYLLGVEVKNVRVTDENKRKYVFVYGEVNGSSVLIVWRTVKDIDFKKDKEIIEKLKSELNPDEIYLNGDSGVKGFKQIESEFKSLLW